MPRPLLVALAVLLALSPLAAQPAPPPQDFVAAIGTSPLRAALAADFSPGTTFTLEAWVYLEAPTEAGWIAGKCLTVGAQDPFLAFALQIISGRRPSFAYSSGSPGSFRALTAPDPLELRTWTHLAAVMDGAVTRLLINGVVVATGTATAAPPDPAGTPFSVGRAFLADGAPNYLPFPGHARQLRLWRVARSADRIAADLVESLPPDRTGLVGAWPLDEAPGVTVVRDIGGAGRSLSVGALAASNPALLDAGPFFAAQPAMPISVPIVAVNQGRLIDFDSDGDADLVTFSVWAPATVPETRTALRAFRNNGGTFVDATAAVLGNVTMTHPSDFAVADFTGDGRVDLLVGGIGSDTPPFPREQTKLLVQTADGRLADETVTRLPQRLTFTHGLAVGDIDGDGDLDIYMGRALSGATPPSFEPIFYLNDGTGRFADSAGHLPAEYSRNSAGDNTSCLVDLNGDGRPDLVLGGVSGPNAILLNDGRGRFAPSPRYVAPPKLGGTDWIVTQTAAADFDGDGRQDFAFVSSGGTWTAPDGRVLTGYGIAGLQLVLNPASGPLRDATVDSGISFSKDEIYVEGIRIIDANRDALPDLLLRVVTNRGLIGRLFINLGPGHAAIFQDCSALLTLAGQTDYLASDFDRDGVVDVLGFSGSSLQLTRGLKAVQPGRLANLSVRTQVGDGDAMLITGFSLGGGTAAKPLLVRAVGPTLSTFGVDGALPDPVLTLAPLNGTPLARNDNWSGAAALKNAFGTVGAFPLADDTSRDAALLVSPLPGSYTATVSGGSGIALVELYDAGSGRSPRLVNVSARTLAGSGAQALIAGFVVDGTLPKRLLIRAAGPTLAGFGLGGTLVDPLLTVRRLGREEIVAANDDWRGTSALKTAFATVGAFAFASDSSADAALVLALIPGAYTVTVSGKTGATGIALVELYELP